MSSRVVERGELVYVRSAPPEPVGDVAEQTRRALARIEELLSLAGTDKSRLLTAQIKLSDLALLPAHESAWHEWLGAGAAPIRAVEQSALEPQAALVEITVTATRHPRLA
ncbi:MAG TPA: Rid family hydrolase [Burkholderiales bacterium]|jgi:enamine deaminase RidA (YjgF/YER057c/UK114 family)|nr:Rid family hydrolase [Burkholderiales bacterium]